LYTVSHHKMRRRHCMTAAVSRGLGALVQLLTEYSGRREYVLHR